MLKASPNTVALVTSSNFAVRINRTRASRFVVTIKRLKYQDKPYSQSFSSIEQARARVDRFTAANRWDVY